MGQQIKEAEEGWDQTNRRLHQLRSQIRSVEQQHNNHRLLGELRAELERLKLEHPEAYRKLMQELE